MAANRFQALLPRLQPTTGLVADLPKASSANKGLHYYATDTGIDYLSDGTAWHPIQAFDPPLCHAYKAAVQNIVTTTLTVLTFDSERYDNSNLHDNVTNPSRITVARAGVYAIKGFYDCAPNVNGTRILYLRLNGSTLWPEARNTVTQSGVDTYATAGLDYKLAVGDYIEAYFYQNSGATLPVAAELSIAYLGAG